MQLFSTILKINESVNRKMFMDLIKEWNDTQMFAENRISDLFAQGETGVMYGDEHLWLIAREYEKENIIAIRYEKSEDDGTVWDTDYVMNFNTMSLSIRLERSYHEQALRTDAKFSTPYFIRLLIEKGYLKDDGVFKVDDQPLFIDASNVSLLADVMSGKNLCFLPVVYISRTYYDEDPVDLHKISRQLKGIAHVLAEKSVFANTAVREACEDRNAYYGAIDIIFPNPDIKPIRYQYHAEKGEDPILREKTVRKVMEYSGAKLLSSLETYNGVVHAILLESLDAQSALVHQKENERQKAVNEMEDVYSTFGNDLEKLRKQVEELSAQSQMREYENQMLREKIRQSEKMPVIVAGEEDEFFPGEIREIVLDALDEKLSALAPESRRAHVIKDLIEHNDYRRISKENAQQIKTLLKDYKTLSAVSRQQLTDLGFVITEEGKHYRLCYHGDPRYKTTISKSGSDFREGRNIAALIIRQFM